MTDVSDSSADLFFDVLPDGSAVFVDGDVVEHPSIKNKCVSSRRRIEEKLERRSLEKDVQEFMFDY
jgi:hypothetical protein